MAHTFRPSLVEGIHNVTLSSSTIKGAKNSFGTHEKVQTNHTFPSRKPIMV